MKRIRLVFVLSIFLFITAIFSTVTASPSAQDSEMVKVTVNLTIENPEYFWRYPFSGKSIDRICVSSVGQRIYIPNLASEQKLDFYIPRSYQFRMSVELQDHNSTLASMFFSKKGINESNNTFNLILKAPDALPIVIKAVGFDEKKIQ